MHRADQIQKDAIKMLVESTGAKIENVETGKKYLEDLNG
jgi:hypothetical protein